MGEIPVDGAYTSTGIEIVSSLHAYGLFGLEPDSDAEPYYLPIDGPAGPAPYGAELAVCAD